MRTAQQVIKDLPPESDFIRLEMELREEIDKHDVDNKDRRILRQTIRDVINYYRSIVRKLSTCAEMEKNGMSKR